MSFPRNIVDILKANFIHWILKSHFVIFLTKLLNTINRSTRSSSTPVFEPHESSGLIVQPVSLNLYRRNGI